MILIFLFNLPKKNTASSTIFPYTCFPSEYVSFWTYKLRMVNDKTVNSLAYWLPMNIHIKISFQQSFRSKSHITQWLTPITVFVCPSKLHYFHSIGHGGCRNLIAKIHRTSNIQSRLLHNNAMQQNNCTIIASFRPKKNQIMISGFETGALNVSAHPSTEYKIVYAIYKTVVQKVKQLMLFVVRYRIILSTWTNYTLIGCS